MTALNVKAKFKWVWFVNWSSFHSNTKYQKYVLIDLCTIFKHFRYYAQIFKLKQVREASAAKTNLCDISLH